MSTPTLKGRARPRAALAVTFCGLLGLLAACGQEVTGTSTTSAKDALYFVEGTAGLPAMYLGEVYTAALAAAGGAGPYSFRQVAGTLPPGLKLSGQTLSGTPAKTGTYRFSLEVTDANLSSKVKEYTVNVQDLPPTALAPTLPVGEIRGETRIPVTISAPRTVRAARLTWELPENVKVTRVQATEQGGLLFWKQDGLLLTLDIGFKAVPRSGARVALISVKPDRAATLSLNRVGYEARDGSGALLSEKPLIAPVPAAEIAPTSTPTPATTTPTPTPAAPGTDTTNPATPSTPTTPSTPGKP